MPCTVRLNKKLNSTGDLYNENNIKASLPGTLLRFFLLVLTTAETGHTRKGIYIVNLCVQRQPAQYGRLPHKDIIQLGFAEPNYIETFTLVASTAAWTNSCIGQRNHSPSAATKPTVSSPTALLYAEPNVNRCRKAGHTTWSMA